MKMIIEKFKGVVCIVRFSRFFDSVATHFELEALSHCRMGGSLVEVRKLTPRARRALYYRAPPGRNSLKGALMLKMILTLSPTIDAGCFEFATHSDPRSPSIYFDLSENPEEEFLNEPTSLSFYFGQHLLFFSNSCTDGGDIDLL